MRFLVTLMIPVFVSLTACSEPTDESGQSGDTLHTEEIEYSANGTTLQGYLAYDEAVEGARPGVLVVHEWWGHNDYARERARMLAGLGYTAFALDMYGQGKVADHPEKAQEFMTQVTENMDLMQRRFDAALELLREQPQTRADDVAAIGYCFGGGVVLNMARAGADLDGVVSFHGSIPTDNPPQKGKVQAASLVLTGGADPFVKEGQLETFTTQMKEAGAGFRVVSYPGVKHSFTNPQADQYGEEYDLPLAYDEEADSKSWEEMKGFLESVFADAE